MSGIASPEQKDAAGKLRNMMSIYKENEDLISIGAYKQGNNPELDRAISHMPKINEFLQNVSHKRIVNSRYKLSVGKSSGFEHRE